MSNYDTCAICLNQFKEEEEVKILACNHIYHVDCIDKWLGLNRRCPLCHKDGTGHNLDV